MASSQRRGLAGSGLPLLLSSLLLLAFAPDLLFRSHLLQGDLPGHLETGRWYALHLWPLPWGWDPRYLGGAPLGILYPPLLGWLIGGLGKLIGVENALRVVLLASILALPPATYAAARGLGLRPRHAGWASVLGLVVLWLPGRGLGGSLRQTLVAGNAANALALPLLGLFLWRLRLAVARPRRWPGLAMLLALILLCHFIVGAVAGLVLGAFSLWRAARTRSGRPLLRGVAIALFSLAAASPFLIPFVTHLGDASPDAVGFSTLPNAFEWLALAALTLSILLHPRWTAHPMIPLLALLVTLYFCRGVVFPLFGTPPFRMEYHRFRLFLYLANVPGWLLLLQSRPAFRIVWRPLAGLASLLVAGLLVFARYDAAGPAPVPRPDWRPDGHRVLVLASPHVQGGSWHGLQVGLPAALGFPAAKGLFVESSLLSRRVFELEKLACGPGARPTRWAIRTDSREALLGLDAPAVAERFAELAVDRVLAREPVSERLERLAVHGRRLGEGFFLLTLPDASWVRRAGDTSPVASEIERHGSRVRFEIDPGGESIVSVNAFSDWRVVEGNATLDRTGHGLLRVRGRGPVVLDVKPRSEEWVGLALGAAAWIALAALALLWSRG